MKLSHDISKLPVLAEGGEGILYVYNDKIIKTYKPHIDIESKLKKINSLIAANIDKGAVMPLEVVYSASGKFIGYLMNKIDGEEFRMLSSKKFVASNNITTKDILKMLVDVQTYLNFFHSKNIFVGDLNDQNILFDKSFNVYFIDCDSWTIGTERCECAFDSFKDPLLKGNDFNVSTDTYAFAVLCWKSLTRLHPYGGTMNPDLNIMDRISKGITVINNPDVKIPRTANNWNNLSPGFINTMYGIFAKNNRVIRDEIIDLKQNLKFCSVDNEYYYSKYDKCPLCNSGAKVLTKPVSIGAQSVLSIIALLGDSNIKQMLSRDSYIGHDGNIHLNNYDIDIIPKFGVKYYCLNSAIDGKYILVEDEPGRIIINGSQKYIFEKKYKSEIVTEGNKVYYITPQNTFTEATVLPQGNSFRNICKCSNNVDFEVINGHYCIINYYDQNVIINVDGVNCVINNSLNIANYGIHFDSITNSWLILFETTRGNFLTYVINNRDVKFFSDEIKYNCSLGGVSIGNGTIFIPCDYKIRGFSYEKNVFKDFECNIVSTGSKLIRQKSGFLVINDENIYSVK